MQKDFHYYATYCAAYLAGYSHDECLDICYSAQFVDLCTRNFLSSVGGPMAAATTQTQMELANADTTPVGLRDITRIWASFHFLPGDLYADRPHCSRRYLRKYRMICNSNSDLLIDTVELAKGGSLQAVGIAMHVLADTWAHRYFAGTPSFVINNTNRYFTELMPDGEERKVSFRHSPGAPDDPENGIYTNSLNQGNEDSIMNLGHGRAGHLPDYSFIRYKYLSSWGDYEETVKDKPHDYLQAFAQMIRAMRYLRGEIDVFEKETYDFDIVEPYRERIETILRKRQLDACEDWRRLGEELSGQEIPEYDTDRYREEYRQAAEEDRDGTFLGKFFVGALAQKSMVTGKIYESGSKLAGYAVDYQKKGFRGIRDFEKLLHYLRGEADE